MTTSSSPIPRPSTPSSLLAGPATRRLTAVGVATAVFCAGCVGGAIDLLLGQDLGLAFVVLFVAGCALAAARVRQRDLLWAVITPPLVFVLLALLAGFVRAGASTSNLLMRQVLEVGAAIVTSAPALVGGTGVAAVMALWRGQQTQRSSLR